MEQTRGRWLTAAGGTLAGVVMLWTRLIDRPHWLYYFDNANFALSIDLFDPRRHQPQPPGYPVFVALLKLLHLAIADANAILIAAGLLGSATGLVLIWKWADALFGRPAAWGATILLLFHLAFWTAGIANPVRTFLVVIAGATALLSWRTMQAARPTPWFLATSAVLGLLSGFRPETIALLFPLWLAAGWYKRIGVRTWLAGATVLAAAVLVWVTPLVQATGGPVTTWQVMFNYLRDTSAGYTAPFGATAAESLATAWRAFRWNFLPALAWLWALPLGWNRLRLRWTRVHSVLLGAAFLPPFLFHAFVHVRNVDQTLISVPVLCVVGGAVVGELSPRLWRAGGLVLAAAISCLLFYMPPLFEDMTLVSHGDIREHNAINDATMPALGALASRADTVVVWNTFTISSRQVNFYYPDARLLLMPDKLWFSGRKLGESATAADGTVAVSGASRLVVNSDAQREDLAKMPGAVRRDDLVILPFGPGQEVTITGTILKGK